MGISNAVPRTIWLIRSASSFDALFSRGNRSEDCRRVAILVDAGSIGRLTREGASKHQVSVFKFPSFRKIKW